LYVKNNLLESKYEPYEMLHLMQDILNSNSLFMTPKMEYEFWFM